MNKNNNATVLKIHQPRPRFPIIKEIKNRFSPRFFASKMVKEKDLKIIFEAARWAPSGHNSQPWQFYFAKKGASAYKKLLATFNKYNQSWAYSAPLFILATFIPKDNKNRYPFARYDLGTAVFSLVIQAQSLGYYSRQIGLFNKSKVKKIFSLNKYCKPYIVIAMGKIGDFNQVPSEIMEYELDPRPRKTDFYSKLKLK